MVIRRSDDGKREKVGRLKPDDQDIIHLFVDGAGEIMMIPRQEAEGWVHEEQPDEPDRHGEMVVVTCVDGREFLVFVWQLRNLLEKWPRKKAAVFMIAEG